MHSATYLLQSKAHTFTSVDEDELPEEEADITQDPMSSGNAFDWALSRADAQLNRMEVDSQDSNFALDVVKHPMGQATLSTMQSVATVTAAAGPQVLKVALPIGKQLLGLSAKALVAGVGAVTAATDERQKRIDQKKRRD